MCIHTSEENGIKNEAIVLQWPVQSTSWDFKVVKKRWAGALLRVKCCCFVQNNHERLTQFSTSPSEEEYEEEVEEDDKERTFWLSGDFLVQYFATFLCATRSLVGHETLEDKWYTVIKASKFRFSEILLYYHILHVHAIHTYRGPPTLC